MYLFYSDYLLQLSEIKMADRGKHSRRFSAKEKLQIILANESSDLYSSDSSIECYYSHESSSESSSEDELPTVTQRKR